MLNDTVYSVKHLCGNDSNIIKQTLLISSVCAAAGRNAIFPLHNNKQIHSFTHFNKVAGFL